MAAKSFLRLVGDIAKTVFGVQVSAGVASAGEIIAAGDDGYLDNSWLNGIGPDTYQVNATEALAAGDYVNIWANTANSGAPGVRKADASTVGKEAHGFVLSAVASGSSAKVYFEATNTQVTGQTPGVVYLSATTPGKGTNTVPSGSGNIVQRIGFAVSPTAVNFQSNPPIALA